MMLLASHSLSSLPTEDALANAGLLLANRTTSHERRFVMFARIVEFIPKVEKKEELFKVVRNEVLPILKKQPGFLEILPFLPESTTDKTFTVTLWAEKRDAERYEQEVYPKVAEIVKPYLVSAITFRHYTVDTTVCPNFMEALTA